MTKVNFKIEASRSSEDADLNSPLTTRLLSAYYYLLPLQMAKRSPTGRDPETRSFFHKFSRHSGRPWFPKWRHKWPQVQIMIRGTTSASRRCNRLLRSCYRPRSIFPPRDHELSTCHLNVHHRPTLLLLLPSFLSRLCHRTLAKFLFDSTLDLSSKTFPKSLYN